MDMAMEAVAQNGSRIQKSEGQSKKFEYEHAKYKTKERRKRIVGSKIRLVRVEGQYQDPAS